MVGLWCEKMQSYCIAKISAASASDHTNFVLPNLAKCQKGRRDCLTNDGSRRTMETLEPALEDTSRWAEKYE
jgi:hypothetical protein